MMGFDAETRKKIDGFIGDKNLLKAANYTKDVSFFDIIKIGGTRHSAMLFDPFQGHGLRDLFI